MKPAVATLPRLATSAASAARKKPVEATRESVLPRRATASARRLALTDDPTTSAPASTDTATATPATTARLVRQKWRRPRIASAVGVMREPAPASRREFPVDEPELPV